MARRGQPPPLAHTPIVPEYGIPLRDTGTDSAVREPRNKCKLQANQQATPAVLVGTLIASTQTNHRRRNEKWVPLVRQMLEDDNTQFASIGAGHFVGSDNVLNQLLADGLEIHRLQ